MQSYLLYHRNAAKFGHSFAEKSLSERGWHVTLAFMQHALESDGADVITTSMRHYLKASSHPTYA